MRVLRQYIKNLLPVVLMIFAIQAKVNAQPPPLPMWTTANTFTYALSCVYFCDAEQAPLRGVVGGTTSISYTLDGGATWTASTITGFAAGNISCFTFKDSLHGWASILDNSPNYGLLMTTDGGLTWNLDSSADPQINGIFYNKTNHRLFVASETDSAEYSTDNGLSWKKFAGIGYTGFAFIGDKFGVMPTHDGTAANPHYYLYTADGGQTWKSSFMWFPGWQPVGIPGTSTFFVTDFVEAEGGGGDAIDGETMWKSDNGGLGWSQVGGFGQQGDPTGSMAGDPCSLFASTTDASVLASTDDGQSWLSLVNPMPPPIISSPIETRFYVSLTRVWAFQGMALSWYPRPLAQPVHVSPPESLNFRSAGCFTADTVVHIYGCSCSNTQLVGDTLDGSSNFTIVSGAIPRTICGVDSVHVQYTPNSTNPDTAFVHLTFNEAGTIVDTVIMVTGPGMPVSISTVPAQIILHSEGCQEHDTIVSLVNNLCNTLTLVSSVLTPAGVNPPGATLQVLNPTLPVTINSRQSVDLPIFVRAIQSGTYYATLEVTVTSGNESVVKDIPVTLLVSNSAVPSLTSVNETVNNVCSLHDTAIWYKNSLCDTIFMYSAPFIDDVKDFKLGAVHVPLFIVPGDSLRIPLSITPIDAGTYSTHIHFATFIDGVALDTSLVVNVVIQHSLKIAATAIPNGANFGATSTCDLTRQITITLQNTTCVPLTLTRLHYTLPDSSYTFIDTIGAGRVLQPGQTDSIVVHFWPNRSTGQSGSIQITYRYSTDSTTVTLPLTGNPTTQVTASLDLNTLQLDSLKLCENEDITTTLHNGPCGAIIIGNINTILNGGFTLISPHQGDTVPVNGSVEVKVHLQPVNAGTDSGAIQINIFDLSGHTGVADTVFLSAQVAAPVRSFTVGAIASDTLLACATHDTTIEICNHGECDTIKITGALASSGAVTVTPQTAVIPVDSCMTFNVHFDPAGTVQDLVGNITLSASPGIVVPYNIPVKSCGSAGVLTLKDTTTLFQTSNCTPLTKTFAIAASNGQITVNSITISGGSQFSQLSITPNVPHTVSTTDSIYVTVTYDPDAAGSNTATIQIDNLSPLILVGKASGAHFNARVGIQSPTPMPITANGANQASFNVTLDDAVAGTLGLQTLTFTVNYNQNILTKTNVQAANGWTLLNVSGSEGQWIIELQAPANQDIPSGTTVATIAALPSLSDTDRTDVTITQTLFNDTTFERCTLSATSAGDVVPVQVAMSCSDSVVERLLQGKPPISALSIVPNPVSANGSEASIRFSMLLTGNVVVDVVNLLGDRVLALENGPLASGDHTVSVPAGSLAEGTYFARVSLDGVPVIQKFVVRKE